MSKVMEYYEDIARKEGIQVGKAEGIELGIKKGIVKGKEEGKISTLVNLVKNGLLTMTQGIQESGLREEEFLKLFNESNITQ